MERAGDVTVAALARWCRSVARVDFGGDEFADAAELAGYLRMEFKIVHERYGVIDSSGAMEDGVTCPDVDVEAEEAVRRIAGVTGKVTFGWYGVSDDPSGMHEVRCSERAHPLEFPMGIGGLYDDKRERPPTARLWAQHMLRL